MDHSADDMIRNYAEGKISWEVMRGRGFDNYADVLAALHRLGLNPPIAPLIGPSAEARQAGIEMLDAHLAAQPKR